MTAETIQLLYLLAAVLFIVGLKMLSGPKTARTGNAVSAAGMATGLAATFLLWESGAAVNWLPLLIGAVLGTAAGLTAALRVPMTGMPQMVALFNGFGGAASLVVALLEVFTGGAGDAVPRVAATLAVGIGAITFSGSLVAFGKLQGWIGGKPVIFPGRIILNLLLLLALLAGVIMAATADAPGGIMAATGSVALLLGILLVIAIGGADMPVVVSLLNAYSGMAVAMTGFALSNRALIVVGTLVGASGLILTAIMCKAMNRSLANVLFGGLGADEGAGGGAGAEGPVREGTAEDAADVLGDARSVIVVPGYGMAVAQAQHAIRELDALLQGRDVEVRYAIHPVAGRMPGHMNVLLAEANIPYEQLFDLDEINGEFTSTDAVLVVGANDVVNPAAERTEGSPIYGMPVLKVWEARTVIVLKRSMRAGFAGIGNELFVQPGTMMVFGDAKETLGEMVKALKE